MADEQTEQIPEVVSEQSAPEPEQAEPVAEPEVSAVADDDGGAVAAGEVQAIDWSKADTARSVLDDPAYKGLRDLIEEARADERNTTRQRLEAERRRQEASDETLQERLRLAAAVKGWDADDEDLKQILAASHEPITRRNQLEVAKAWVDGAKSYYPPEAVPVIDAAMDQALRSEDPLYALVGDEEQPGLVSQLWDGYGRSVAEGTINSVSLEQVPANSKLRKDIDAYIESQLEAEMKARAKQANAINPGPSSSRGGVGGGASPTSLADYEKLLASPDYAMSSADWVAYERLRKDAGLK